MRQNKNSFRSFRFPQLKFHLPAVAVAASPFRGTAGFHYRRVPPSMDELKIDASTAGWGTDYALSDQHGCMGGLNSPGYGPRGEPNEAQSCNEKCFPHLPVLSSPGRQ